MRLVTLILVSLVLVQSLMMITAIEGLSETQYLIMCAVGGFIIGAVDAVIHNPRKKK